MQIAYLTIEKMNTIIRRLVEIKEVDLMIMTAIMKMKKNTQMILEINPMRKILSTKNSGQIAMPLELQMPAITNISKQTTILGQDSTSKALREK